MSQRRHNLLRKLVVVAGSLILGGCEDQDSAILTTHYVNPAYDTSKPTWAGDLCHGGTFLKDAFPPYEWMQILDPASEFDDRVVGVSGVVVGPHESGADVPFTHPFGLDWNFAIAPDPGYQSLLAPSNLKDEETKHAVEMGLSVPKGVIGVETDQGLIPPKYRAKEGDRVVVFGRWIVDAGHDDYEAEIHPPLLMVTARPGGGAVDPNLAFPPSEATSAFLISRPWLVGQRYEVDNEPLRQHLLNELYKVLGFQSLRMEAHPKIYKPFTGIKLLRFTMRAPSARKSPQDKLLVNYHFTVRSGVTVQVYKAAGDSIGVLISMNEANYQTAPLPPRKNWYLPFSWLSSQTSVLKWIQGLTLVFHPFAGIVISQDWITDRYDAAIAKSVTDSYITRLPVDDLSGGLPFFSVDNSQPFPIYGEMRVQWERHP